MGRRSSKTREAIPFQRSQATEAHHATKKEVAYNFKPSEKLTPKEAQGILTGEIKQGKSK